MSWFDRLPEYPVSSIFDAFSARDKTVPLLIEAEPGAGKSTLLPLWVLREIEQSQSDKIIYLVQPRILAAQSLARRLADLTDSTCGELVGYQVPYDNNTSLQTRLVVTTPGLLLQKVLSNPEADNVACVILDEIHERSVNQDLLFAILQEAQLLNDSLELILMTATPDPKLQQAITQRLQATGFCFPVDVRYLPPSVQKPSAYFERDELPKLVLEALDSIADLHQQTLLIFLSGWSAIDYCHQAIVERYSALSIYRLHSRVDAREQAAALNEDSGPRIILSTNIAETSLTIKDVTWVVDSGLVRRQVFDQRNGVARLRTGRISQASAEQRAGRAGRVRAGNCIRLWSKDERLAAADLPELRATDYLPIALKLAHWGAPVESLPWLERPNAMALKAALSQLKSLSLIDDENRITAQGVTASELGTHPRIACILLNLNKAVHPQQILLVALALHFEWQQGDDLYSWLMAAALEFKRNHLWKKQAQRWRHQLDLQKADIEIQGSDLAEADKLIIAKAYVDRIGIKQTSGRYSLASGAAFCASLQEDYACALMLKRQGESLMAIALPIILDEKLKTLLSQELMFPSFKNGRWVWLVQRVIGGRVLEEIIKPWDDKLPEAIIEKIEEEQQEHNKTTFFSERLPTPVKKLLLKSRLLISHQLLSSLPLDDDELLDRLNEWLLPFIQPTTNPNQLPWREALEFYLGFERLQKIEQLLPEYIELPSGRKVAIEFNELGEICVAAKLQEFFGCEELSLAKTGLPIKISLLSPNGSSLAVTSNLKTFWTNGYPDVRKDMRGRYPRHPWPENPLEHEATALTKKRLAQQQ